MATHKVTILFEDGRSVAIDAEESNTIYLSALKNKVRIDDNVNNFIKIEEVKSVHTFKRLLKRHFVYTYT